MTVVIYVDNFIQIFTHLGGIGYETAGTVIPVEFRTDIDPVPGSARLIQSIYTSDDIVSIS